MAQYNFFSKKNNAFATLNSNLFGGDSTVLVSSLVTFPASPSFMATIWNSTTYADPSSDPDMEIVKVTGISSGNTFTVTRGQEGTITRFHSVGSSIAHLFTIGQIQELESQINTIQGLGVIPSEQFIDLSSDYALINNNVAQQAFGGAGGVGLGAVTLLSSTTYHFETLMYIATGATTHTTAFGFAGGASFTSCNYYATLSSAAAQTIATAVSVLQNNTSAVTVLNATSASVMTTISIWGSIRINAGGTVIPQIKFSAAPNGTCLTKTGSFFRVWPIGSSTVKYVGSWT